MIRINLLPHREEKRRRLRIQFAVLAGLALVAGVALVGLVHAAISGQIEYQQGRNKFLNDQIAILDRQIDEIKKLKDQLQQLLSRKKVVETLQSNRSDVVHLLDDLVRQLPEGVYLKSVKQVGPKVTVTGYAQSNARVSTLMRSLEASPNLEKPTLVEIKAATVANRRANEFTLTLAVTRQPPPAGDKKPAAAGKPAAGAGQPAAAGGTQPMAAGQASPSPASPATPAQPAQAPKPATAAAAPAAAAPASSPPPAAPAPAPAKPAGQ